MPVNFTIYETPQIIRFQVEAATAEEIYVATPEIQYSSLWEKKGQLWRERKLKLKKEGGRALFVAMGFTWTFLEEICNLLPWSRLQNQLKLPKSDDLQTSFLLRIFPQKMKCPRKTLFNAKCGGKCKGSCCLWKTYIEASIIVY